MLVIFSFCFSKATSLTYIETKTGLRQSIHKSHGQIIAEEKGGKGTNCWESSDLNRLSDEVT